MLFPNKQVQFKLFDKIRLAITGGGGSIFGIFSVMGKLGTVFSNIFALIGVFITFIGIIIRQVIAIFIT